MALTQRLVELGRSARSKEKIKTRQPLAKARISTESFELLERSGLLDELAGEVNVNAIEPFQSEGQLVDYEVKPNFRELGTPVRAGDAHGRRGDPGGRRPARAGRAAARVRRGRRRRRRRVDRDRPRRGRHRRAPARGLVGGQRAWRDDRARRRADSRAGARGPRPRRGAVGPRGAQDGGTRRLRPDHADAGRPTATLPPPCASTPTCSAARRSPSTSSR